MVPFKNRRLWYFVDKVLFNILLILSYGIETNTINVLLRITAYQLPTVVKKMPMEMDLEMRVTQMPIMMVLLIIL